MYAHPKDDLKAFRYITSNFIHQGLCRKTEVQRCFHVSEDSVQRAYKNFVEKDEAGFFGDDARKGTAYKITGDCRLRIQNKLDKGQSVNSIAKQEGVRESAIRYGTKQGYLKKGNSNEIDKNGSTLNMRNEAGYVSAIRNSHYPIRRQGSCCAFGSG